MIAVTNESNLLMIVAAIAVVCTIALFFSSALPVVLTVACGAVIVGVTPGYGWTYALFRKKDMTLPLRLLISIPLSIVITASCTFVMSASLNISLTPLAVQLALLAIALAGSGVAYFLDRTTH